MTAWMIIAFGIACWAFALWIDQATYQRTGQLHGGDVPVILAIIGGLSIAFGVIVGVVLMLT